MKYITDDGKNTFMTAEECLAFEEAQKIDGVIDQEIGEYLDAVRINVTDENGKETFRNLSSREFKRRETVIKGWIQWDRDKHPERYEQAPADAPVVNITSA